MGDWRFLPARTVLGLTGPEALPFLNKLATQDLETVSSGGCAYAALLSPQGKVQSDFLVWRAEDGLLLDVPAGRADALLAKLALFKLRAQVELALRPDLRAVSAPRAGEGVPLSGPDPRLATLGWRGIAPAAAAFPEADPVGILAQRVALGMPDLAEDAEPEEIFGLEGLLEELQGVSFKKGCFPGQENVSRMKRRATTRKKFCRLRVEGAAPGDAVVSGDIEVGTVRASANGHALALLRLDRALEAAAKGATLTVAGRQAVLDPPDWLILPTAEDD